jgi:hypothetical protein
MSYLDSAMNMAMDAQEEEPNVVYVQFEKEYNEKRSSNTGMLTFSRFMQESKLSGYIKKNNAGTRVLAIADIEECMYAYQETKKLKSWKSTKKNSPQELKIAKGDRLKYSLALRAAFDDNCSDELKAEYSKIKRAKGKLSDLEGKILNELKKDEVLISKLSGLKVKHDAGKKVVAKYKDARKKKK